MPEEETKEMLSEVIRLLRIIARPQLTEIGDRFGANMLTSSKRDDMWEAMDGSKTLADIAKEAGVSPEAVRQFVREIEESFPDLIEFAPGSGPQRPRRRLI